MSIRYGRIHRKQSSLRKYAASNPDALIVCAWDNTFTKWFSNWTAARVEAALYTTDWDGGGGGGWRKVKSEDGEPVSIVPER